MSDTTASLQQKINSADDLQSVVRTMKALAASSIGQYEQVGARIGRLLSDRGVRVGRVLSRRHVSGAPMIGPGRTNQARGRSGAVVFGSDQGLVGQFNDEVAEYALKSFAALPGTHHESGPSASVFTRACRIAGLAPLGLLDRTEFSPGHRPTRRADPRGERDAPQPR